jgi:hypothetical protein
MVGMGAAKHLHVASGLGYVFIYLLPLGSILLCVRRVAVEG